MKPYAEYTWSVNDKGRPSVRRLLKTLITKPDLPEAPRTAAVAVQIKYVAAGTGWVDWQSGKRVHHLNQPGAHAISKLVTDRLVAAGIVEPGQIIAVQVVKLVGDDNQLEVTLQLVSRTTKKDKPFRRYKLLKWYVAECKRVGKKPTKAGYWKLLHHMEAQSPVDAEAIDASLLDKASQ